jgi:hypothetical protein
MAWEYLWTYAKSKYIKDTEAQCKRTACPNGTLVVPAHRYEYDLAATGKPLPTRYFC